jgi:molybdopterin converting factor small subunit
MQITVHFYSYFKDLTGCSESRQTATEGETLGDLLDGSVANSRSWRRCEVDADSRGVGLPDRDYRLKEGDEVSLFPPVQGG